MQKLKLINQKIKEGVGLAKVTQDPAELKAGYEESKLLLERYKHLAEVAQQASKRAAKLGATWWELGEAVRLCCETRCGAPSQQVGLPHTDWPLEEVGQQAAISHKQLAEALANYSKVIHTVIREPAEEMVYEVLKPIPELKREYDTKRQKYDMLRPKGKTAVTDGSGSAFEGNDELRAAKVKFDGVSTSVVQAVTQMRMQHPQRSLSLAARHVNLQLELTQAFSAALNSATPTIYGMAERESIQVNHRMDNLPTIGAPTNVQREAHMGFDKGGLVYETRGRLDFEAANMPPDWQSLLGELNKELARMGSSGLDATDTKFVIDMLMKAARPAPEPKRKKKQGKQEMEAYGGESEASLPGLAEGEQPAVHLASPNTNTNAPNPSASPAAGTSPSSQGGRLQVPGVILSQQRGPTPGASTDFSDPGDLPILARSAAGVTVSQAAAPPAPTPVTPPPPPAMQVRPPQPLPPSNSVPLPSTTAALTGSPANVARPPPPPPPPPLAPSPPPPPLAPPPPPPKCGDTPPSVKRGSAATSASPSAVSPVAAAGSRSALMDQIRNSNVKLRKVEPPTLRTPPPGWAASNASGAASASVVPDLSSMTTSDKGSLMSALAQAVARRRYQCEEGGGTSGSSSSDDFSD